MPTNREGMEGGMNFMGCLLGGGGRRREKDAPLSVLQNGNIGTEIDGD